MEASDNPDGTLVLSHDGTLWPRWLFGFAAILLATAGYDLFIGPRGTDRMIGLLASVATCIGAGILSLEKAHFVVDPSRRTITYSRQWGVRARSGLLTFDQVRSVLIQTPIGDDGIPSRRIVLQLANGPDVPLTVGYRPDHDDGMLRSADRIRRALGLATDEPPAASVQRLVDQGHTIEAIKQLRREEGLSLTEARSRVEALKARRP